MASTTPRVAYLPATNPGLRWLSRQLAWEQRLSDLREPLAGSAAEDDSAAA